MAEPWKPKPFWQCPSCKVWTEETAAEHDCDDTSNRLTLYGTPPLHIPDGPSAR